MNAGAIVGAVSVKGICKRRVRDRTQYPITKPARDKVGINAISLANGKHAANLAFTHSFSP